MLVLDGCKNATSLRPPISRREPLWNCVMGSGSTFPCHSMPCIYTVMLLLLQCFLCSFHFPMSAPLFSIITFVDIVCWIIIYSLTLLWKVQGTQYKRDIFPSKHLFSVPSYIVQDIFRHRMWIYNTRNTEESIYTVYWATVCLNLQFLVTFNFYAINWTGQGLYLRVIWSNVSVVQFIILSLLKTHFRLFTHMHLLLVQCHSAI